MKKLLLIALTGAAVFGVVGAAPAPASAQGFYVGPGYSQQPYYRERYVAPRYQRRYVQQRRYGRSCPRGYSVQDGACKPYRGY
jgi:hypothetical protein